MQTTTNTKITIDLNCDMGESFGAYSFGNDEELLRVVTSANIACGFHAGDPTVMRQTVERAVASGAAIGAHPGLPDLLGFGRRVLGVSASEAFDCVAYQVSALQVFARIAGAKVSHAKPHGALYNMAVSDDELAEAVAQAVKAADADLILVGLAGSALVEAGLRAGLRVAREGFCDRLYEFDGSLAPRSRAGAVFASPEEAARQAVSIALERKTRARNAAGEEREIPVEVETLCVHGDAPRAVEFARAVRAALVSAGATVRALEAEALRPQLRGGR